MVTTDRLVQYCEQPIISGLLEPINTLTNFFFFATVVFLILYFRKNDIKDFKAIYLTSLIFLIAIGSLAWHFYRHPITLAMDSIPIMIFLASFTYIYFYKISRNHMISLLILVSSFVFTSLLENIIDLTGIDFFLFRGFAITITSSIIFFLILQPYVYKKDKHLSLNTLLILLIFLLSLTFRQLDLPLCNSITSGTHFLWHILNSIGLYLMVRTLYEKRAFIRILKPKD